MSVPGGKSEESVRTFIAIELPLTIREDLSQIGMQIDADLPRRAIRWVKPANIHLTLRFLGDTPLDLVSNISHEIDVRASKLEPFVLRLGVIGCFPNPRRPRIIWIGLEGDADKLLNLQEMVESAVEKLGWKRENRNFHPHLTIGRVKDSKLVAHSGIPYNRKLLDRSFSVDSVYLIRSILEPTGAVYSPLYKCNLGKA
jgi:2'-5' RNA ligase